MKACPHCGVSLVGEPIPGRDGDHYSLVIGVEIPDIYDGVLFWQCPSCEGRWHRWSKGDYLRKRAEPYVNR